MPKFFHSVYSRLAAALGILALSACSPKYDWREVRPNDAHFVVLMPAKPATLSRPVDLGGIPVTMTMTAAEVDGVNFAVGTAELPQASQAPAALNAMKTAMVKNINGSIKHEKPVAGTPANADASIELEASGTAADGHTRLLLARFAASGKRVYQAVVIGREQNISRESAETFLTSFKPN